MSDETPPHGIERTVVKHPSGRGRTVPSIHARNQPQPTPSVPSNEAPNPPSEEADPTKAEGIERTFNTGRKPGIIKPTLKLRVIKGGKED